MPSNTGKTKVSADFGRRGWLLVIYCLLVFFFGSAVGCLLNVFASVLHAERGWDTVVIFSANTWQNYITMALYYILGIALSKGKINLRIGILVCGILSAVSVALWGVAPSPFLFVVVFCITCCSSTVWGQFINNTITNNWFPTKKGLVMGWTTVGFPVGSAFGVLIWNKLEAILGHYSRGFLLYSFIYLALAIFGFLAFRAYPEELGLFPDNDKSMTREKAKLVLEEGQRLAENSPWTPKRCLKTWQVWALGYANSTIIFYATGAVGQMIPNLIEFGYDQSTAVLVMTFACCFAAVTSILLGALDAKVGTKNAMIITLLVAVFGSIMRNTNTTIGLWISVICVSTLMGGGPNFVVSSVSTFWGRYHFGKVYGTVMVINSLLGGIAPTVIAIVAKNSGYATAYLVSGANCLVGALVLSLIKHGFTEKCEAKFALEDAK